MWFSFALLLASFGLSSSLDFCTKNLLPRSKMSNSLQFTKELSVWEFAVESRFKSLHCCSKGYLSIEWFKDGRPYPWPSDVSSFILYPEAANQTIYTKLLSTSDAGNYTCRLHNDTSYNVHSTELKVFEATGYMGSPLATYRPPNTSFAQAGQSTRMFCEAFVGHIDLPDANNEVKWEMDRGGGPLRAPHVTIDHTSREKGQIVGAYLTINDMDESDFGTYSCSISNTGDQQIVMTTELKAFELTSDKMCVYNELMITFGVAIAILTLGVLLYVRKLRVKQVPSLRLFAGKMIEMALTRNRNPSKGVVVLYGERNEVFVEETFLPYLQRHTTLCPRLIRVSRERGLTEDNKDLCRKTEKVIILLSSQIVKEWSWNGINECLQTLFISEAEYCLVLLQALPDPHDRERKLFQGQPSNFTLVSWNEKSFNGNFLFRNDNEDTNSTKEHRLALPKFSIRKLRSTTSPLEAHV